MGYVLLCRKKEHKKMVHYDDDGDADADDGDGDADADDGDAEYCD